MKISLHITIQITVNRRVRRNQTEEDQKEEKYTPGTEDLANDIGIQIELILFDVMT